MYCRRELLGQEGNCNCMHGCGRKYGLPVPEIAVVVYNAFQGILPEDIVIKNIAVVNNTRDTAQLMEFAPPYSFAMLPYLPAKKNAILTSEVHGLKWGSGHIPYDKLEPVLKEKTSAVTHLFTRGTSSASFLTKLLKRPVLDIETFLTKYEARMSLSNDQVDIPELVRVVNRRCCSDHSGLKEKPSQSLECCYTAALRLAKYLDKVLKVINFRTWHFQQVAKQFVHTDIDPVAVGLIKACNRMGLGFSAVDVIALLLQNDAAKVYSIIEDEAVKADLRVSKSSAKKPLECACACNQCTETKYYRAASIDIPH